MKDIPMFTGEYGVASLILKEIPHTQLAYIKLHSTLEPDKLLQECIAFCRMCGAETILASGHSHLESYPLHTRIYGMQCPRDALPESDACLFPVTEQTLPQWLQIYNQRMNGVDNSAYMDSRDGKQMLQSGDGYFVHKDGKLLGIGRASGDTVDAVIAAEPGMGQRVLSALAGALSSELVHLTVAGTNQRAIRLYERLGFLVTREISSWYLVYTEERR